MYDEGRFRIVCSADDAHDFLLDASKLEALILDGDYACTEEGCDGELELDENLELMCHVFDMTFEVRSLDDARLEIEFGCEGCRQRTFDGNSIHVPHSFFERFDSYKWAQENQDPRPILVNGRTDYWEGLIHFCEIEEFVSIIRDERIKASPTGLFRCPAVCLSEATMGNWKPLQQQHGGFGLVFRKRSILGIGGAPVLYLPASLIRAQDEFGGFAPAVQPFVTLLRTKRLNPTRPRHDFLHEREWRTSCDIHLTGDTKPFAVIIDWEQVSPEVDDWKAVFHAASNFQELDPPTATSSLGSA